MPAPARDHSADRSRDPRTPALRRTIAIILALNGGVAAAKLGVAISTGALTVLGAALESGLDLLNNVLGLVLVSVAAREPDEEHPYGHGKFETVGALAVVGFLSISCFELLRSAVAQIWRGEVPPPPGAFEMAVLAATLVVNVLVVRYERRRGHELQSAFLLADAEHTRSDVFVTLLALASVLLARVGLGGLDAPLAVVVALVIAWSGYRIVRETVPVLVDTRAVPTSAVLEAVRPITAVRGVRDIRSRRGPAGVLHAELTVLVDGGVSVEEGHAIADAVEDALEHALGPADVIVHVEPA